MDVLILLFLIIFMLHNLEEIITIEKWFQNSFPRVRSKIPSFVQNRMKQFEAMTSSKFALVVFVFSIGVSVVILIGAFTNHDFYFIGANLLFAVNIFTHPLQALYLRTYTPGLWTSLFLVIPYYIGFFYYLSIAGFLTMNMIIPSFIVVLILIPVFLFSHKVGERIG